MLHGAEVWMQVLGAREKEKSRLQAVVMSVLRKVAAGVIRMDHIRNEKIRHGYNAVDYRCSKGHERELESEGDEEAGKLGKQNNHRRGGRQAAQRKTQEWVGAGDTV